MRNRALHFDNGRGHRLAARLDLPDARPRGFALLAHCFTCSKNLHATTQVSRALAEAGYGVLRFDFTGLGASEGELANSDFSGNVEDLVAAARFLEAEHQAPQLLVGHSLGGAAVLRAAGRLPAVRAVATIGAPAHPLHVERLLRSAREEIESSGRAEVELAGRRFTITRGFLDDLQEQPMRDAIAGLRRALLVLHAPRDSVVGIDNAAAIFEAAKHPKSFVSLDRADHLLTAHGDADFAGSVIATWAARYLEPLTTDPDAPEPAVGEEVVVRGPEQGFRTEVDAGGHALVADEPREVGGTATGSGPYGLLLAGLGACTAMTLRMYADRKQWPLRRADVRLRHAKVHARDCEGAGANQTGMLDCIERTVVLRGELDDAQRARLLEIADKCPVHRTLRSEISIKTTLAER
ncbi:MAG: alpha/beta fold hydrolase [Myxococcales bacterium]|nr:alpha/beta fold hydrolase [Myxococcales bacterium]MCB9718820.1 alpha/beta fold hydrolase [Myxococcales bacterium]